MNKTLLHLLTAMLFSLTALPGISHAAPDGDDYVAMQVPNMTQAVAFFRDVMNCSPISGSRPGAADQIALMACGRETTVEIRQAAAAPLQASRAAQASARVVTLEIDDASGVTAWLRTHRVHLIGSPARLTAGPDAGKIAVSFLTPWGEPLRLVSRTQSDDLLPSAMPSSRVASQ